jgi:hypothetical protein
VDGDSAIVPVMLYDEIITNNGRWIIRKGSAFPSSKKIKQELEYSCLLHIQKHIYKAIAAFITVGKS